jgi:hypothetical protein
MVVMLTYYASMLVVQTLRTTMMAGPRTVGLGCFSPVQRLDERSKASSDEKVWLHAQSNGFRTRRYYGLSAAFI